MGYWNFREEGCQKNGFKKGGGGGGLPSNMTELDGLLVIEKISRRITETTNLSFWTEKIPLPSPIKNERSHSYLLRTAKLKTC